MAGGASHSVSGAVEQEGESVPKEDEAGEDELEFEKKRETSGERLRNVKHKGGKAKSWPCTFVQNKQAASDGSRRLR